MTITSREAAIIAAYTGTLIGDFATMHGYIEEIMERPVWTHEMGESDVWAEIKRRAKPDFLLLKVDGSSGPPVDAIELAWKESGRTLATETSQ